MKKEVTHLHFSIEGPFITNLARERFYQNHDLSGAVKLLMECLQCDSLTEEKRFLLALRIINGTAEIVGTYPGDDYGVNELKDKDSSFGLIQKIDNMGQKIKQLEEESQNNLQKFLTLLDFLDLPEYKLRELENKYYSLYGKHLFPDLELGCYPDSTLQAINKFNKQDPVSSYISHTKNAREDDYGWLAPDGTYYPVPWGEHAKWAQEYLDEHYPFRENAGMYWVTDSNGDRRHVVNGDCLIYKLHWVLLDNPYQGVAKPQYDPVHGLTKAQKEFLYDYYIERNLHEQANELYDNE